MMVKLVPLEIEAMRGPVGVSAVVLHVTPRRPPAEAVGVIVMSLCVVTAVVLTVQVAPEAFVAQEKAPAGAAEQLATDGLVAVPAAEQFVVDVKVVPFSVVKEPAAGVVPPIAPGEANVAPPSDDAFKFATLVVDATVSGAVPVATEDVRVVPDIAPANMPPLKLTVFPAELALIVVVPLEFPFSPIVPEPIPAPPKNISCDPSVVKPARVCGAIPAPPPKTGLFAVSAADVAHVVALLKYGIPPLVPATVKAGVVVGVATETRPPVKETLETVPVPVPVPHVGHETTFPETTIGEVPVMGAAPIGAGPCCGKAATGPRRRSNSGSARRRVFM